MLRFMVQALQDPLLSSSTLQKLLSSFYLHWPQLLKMQTMYAHSLFFCSFLYAIVPSLWSRGSEQGVLKANKKISVRTETNCNKICFGLFCETNNKKCRFVSVFLIYIKTTETNRTVLKQAKTTLNFLENTKICSLSNCFGWSSVCFGSIKTLKLSVCHRSITTETNCFETNCFETNPNKPKQTGKILNFLKKIPKYAPYQTVLVGLLFVSVQSKH